ncbi:MAG: hypothetical protein Q9183_004001 [Haloplaca sp. 2 TL-2023]
MRQVRIYTRSDIESLIQAGDSIVINDGAVLRLNKWLDYHPGGRLVIQHMVGRDATDEISIYHSARIVSSMQRYRIGRIQEPWLNFIPPIREGSVCPNAITTNTTLSKSPDNGRVVEQALEDDINQYPPLDAKTQEAIVGKYRALHAKIKSQGYYKCRYGEYAKEAIRCLLIFGAFLVALRSGWFIAAAMLLGSCWVWLMSSLLQKVGNAHLS